MAKKDNRIFWIIGGIVLLIFISSNINNTETGLESVKTDDTLSECEDMRDSRSHYDCLEDCVRITQEMVNCYQSLDPGGLRLRSRDIGDYGFVADIDESCEDILNDPGDRDAMALECMYGDDNGDDTGNGGDDNGDGNGNGDTGNGGTTTKTCPGGEFPQFYQDVDNDCKLFDWIIWIAVGLGALIMLQMVMSTGGKRR